MFERRRCGVRIGWILGLFGAWLCSAAVVLGQSTDVPRGGARQVGTPSNAGVAEVQKAAEGWRATVTLTDGQILYGYVLPKEAQTADPLHLTLPGAGLITISRSVIKEVALETREEAIYHQASQFGWRNPSASRYMYAPSAIPLPKGTGYISQKELVATEFGYGITSNIGIELGSLLPLAIYGLVNGQTELLNAMIGVKVGAQMEDHIWIGGGFQTFLAGGEAAGIGFANLTLGEPDRNVTVVVGKGLGSVLEEAPLPVVVAGVYRFRNGLAWLTENWLIIDDTSVAVFSGVGMRIIRPSLTVDVTLVNSFVGGDYVPIPWVDFAWYFKSKR